MRIARSITTLDPVDVGDHVCWLVGADDDVKSTAGAFVADGALFGDKVLIIGSADAAWSKHHTAGNLITLDPKARRMGGGRWDADAMLGVVRREADTADRQGFRALRVLAQMHHVWPDGAASDEVASHELDLDSLVADGGAILVCSYRMDRFTPGALEQAAGMHPQHLGVGGSLTPSFRLYNEGADCWSVHGVIDIEGVSTFRTAVGELMARRELVRLRCEGLQLMDASGMVALAEAARALPGRRLFLEGANNTLRRCWELLGYDSAEIPVEMAP